jgi:hypothetical protein
VTRYRVRGAAREPRALLLEHPRQPDWSLVTPPERDVELTRDRYRIPVALGPGEDRTVEVTVQRPRTTRLELTGQPATTFLGIAGSGALDPAVRRAFEALAALRGDVDREERALAELEGGRRAIHEEQERLRQNLASVPGPGDLRQRYLDKLRQQEDELDRLQAGIAAARGRVAAARQRLADAIGALEL